MNAVANYVSWVFSGSWARKRPAGSSMTWGRLAASWLLATILVALLFAGLAAGGFLGAVAVALLFPFAQAAIVVGLVYASRVPRRTR